VLTTISSRRGKTTCAIFVIATWCCSAPAQEAKNKPAAPDAKQTEKTPKGAPSTLDNLMTAFEGESNAHARYVEFAKKADAEGYGPVGSLFRAAARAEQIHAANHAEVIKKMGGTPKVDIKKIEAKSTKDNLDAALAGENYERLEMYPGFITKAKTDDKPDAVKTFNYAQMAETEHAKLFKQALDELAQWKGGKKDFYVCTVCGYTTMNLNFEKCLSCFSPKEKYEKVN
jgi:rubrerythrin